MGSRARSCSSASALAVPSSPCHTNVVHRNSTQELSFSAPSHSFLSQPNNYCQIAGHPSQHHTHADASAATETEMAIEFDNGVHCIVRPNRIIRGKVVLVLLERLHVTQIRIRFRAEESAMVRVEEGGSDGRGEWLHSVITTFFDTEWKLHGSELQTYAQSAWDVLEPGRYIYPFALKFPNVNYPPSVEELPGFAIRFIWTAQADGPAGMSGVKSREYITPYRPIIISTPDKEWVYKTTLLRDKKKEPTAEVQAKLSKQIYCPDDPFKMRLRVSLLHADARITAIAYKFRKHHEGKMLVQHGTAFCEYIRTVIKDTVHVSSRLDPTDMTVPIEFNVPTRLVSPSFRSRHTRVCYDLLFEISVEHGHIFKGIHTYEVAIPLSIANLPHEHMLHVPELTSIRHYQNDMECPLFFDPSLDGPPPLLPVPASSLPQAGEPPSYSSLPNQPTPPQLPRERHERTVFLSRPLRGVRHMFDLPEATVIEGRLDEDW